ncbi:uncharacterized protein LOC128156943 isoform X2 [Crassostrea angulata]|nr:uncharacterized protein LOC128156943 isoform X2 [Crassostrea angulata]
MANQAVEIIVETSRCRHVVSILSSESVLAVDCEGIALGVEGPMTLLQICTYSGDVYLFDVQENRELFSEGHLKIVLESNEILKVIHACSYDSAALYHQFGVTLQNVFDTQVADTVLEEHNGRLLVSSLDLLGLCQKYSSSKKVSDYKEQLKIQYSKTDGEFWAKRPLTDEMKSVAEGDVKALIPVFEKQKQFIWKSGLHGKFQERVSETIKYYIDDEVRKHKFKRKFIIVNQIIDSINEKWDTHTVCSDFPEDSDEYEALKRIDYREACIKSPFIDRLKTDSIVSDLKELDDKLSRDEKDYDVKWIPFSLLSSIIDHPNKTVSKLANDVKQKFKNVVLQEIYDKYTIEANLKHLTKCEKDVLRSLNLNGTNNQRFPKHVVRLYWLLREDDINKNCKKLIEMGNGFQLYGGEWFYVKTMSYLRSGAHVPVSFKQSVWRFKRKLDETFGRDVVPPTLVRKICLID